MIENWKEAYKMLSVWVFAIAGALAGLEQFLPALEGQIPPLVYVGLMILGIIARLIRQKNLATEDVVEELRRAKALLKNAGLISLVLLACVGCTKAPDPKLAVPNDAEAECIALEFARKTLEEESCGDNVEGPCASKAIMKKSVKKRLACLEKY